MTQEKISDTLEIKNSNNLIDEKINSNNSQDQKNNPYLKWIVIIAVALIITLPPFHYVPSRMMMFPKNSLTFSYTIITEDDICSIIERYNKASFLEKQAMNNEPIIRKLMEKEIIVEKKDSDNSNNE